MTLVIFLIILSILILVHELGHFIVAKRTGIKVEEFGLGFPPRIWAKKIGETTYSINALLFGGFVRLYGEEKPEEAEKERSFFEKSKRVRAAVIVSGVLMNFLLAVLAFSILYSVLGIPRKVDFVKVVGISENSPAQKAGIVVDDIILAVDSELVHSNKQFVQLIELEKGKEILLSVKRGEDSDKIYITPRASPPEGEGPLGVAITDTELYFPSLPARPFWGIVYGLQESLFWGSSTVAAVGRIFEQLITRGEIPRDIAGPVGIFQITANISSGGYVAILSFLGILSVNLAILNILPFPALDGGRLLFIGLEAILGRKIAPRVERAAHAIGMAILLFLLLAITIQDIGRLLTSEGFSSFIRKVSP